MARPKKEPGTRFLTVWFTMPREMKRWLEENHSENQSRAVQKAITLLQKHEQQDCSCLESSKKPS